MKKKKKTEKKQWVLKWKIKQQRQKIIELEKDIKAEIIIKTEEPKLETLRKIIEKQSRKLNTEIKIKKIKKLIKEEIDQRVQ